MEKFLKKMIKKITVQKNAQLVCFLPWIPMEDVRGHYKKKTFNKKKCSATSRH